MAGHLRSRKAAGNGGRSNAKWKRSWFVLKDRVLYHYKASEDTVAVETLPVLGWNLQLPQPQDFKVIKTKFIKGGGGVVFNIP